MDGWMNMKSKIRWMDAQDEGKTDVFYSLPVAKKREIYFCGTNIHLCYTNLSNLE